MRERLGEGRHPDVAPPHLVHVFVGRVAGLFLLPAVEQAFGVTVEVHFQFGIGRPQLVEGGVALLSGLLLFQQVDGLLQPEELARQFDLAVDPGVVAAVVLGNFRKVARAIGRDDVDLFAHFAGGDERRVELSFGLIDDLHHDAVVEGVHARVVELGGDSAEYRHVVERLIEELMVALELFLHIAQRVEGAPLIELIDGDEVGKVEHVDLFQLSGGAVLGRHHVKRQVGMVDDLGIGLSDAGSFQDDEVVAGGLEDVDGALHVFGKRQVRLPGGQ